MRQEPIEYALLDMASLIVLPVDRAVQVFRLLTNAEVVTYNWSDKDYTRDYHRSACDLKTFSIQQYAQLALNDAGK